MPHVSTTVVRSSCHLTGRVRPGADIASAHRATGSAIFLGMFRQLACVLFCTTALAQASEPYTGPIIDMHIHVYAKDPRWDADVENPVTGHKITAKSEEAHRMATVAQFKQHNIVGAMVGNDLEVARRWRDALGKDIWIGYAIEDPAAVDSVVLEREARAHHIDAIAEVAPYYAGIAPDDTRLEPMWKLAEELDLPVGFHVHPGPPGPLYMGIKEARADNVSPKALDKVLVRHPKLRLYVMHAGYPMLEEMLLLMYMHPQVYVDLGAISWSRPQAEFHRYLQRLVEAGYEDRVMFGSDQMVWPETIGLAVEAVDSAPFLTTVQKRKIFYENARRFMRVQ